MILRKWILGIVVLLCGSALADEVVLKDGTTLFGTIKAVSENKVVVTTEFMGEVKVDLESVASMRSDDAREFVLESGETVIEPLRVDDGKQALGADGDVALGQVLTIRTPGSDESPPPPIVPPAPEPKVDWSGNVNLGLNGRTGNTERISLTLRTEANRTTDIDRLRLYFDAFYGEEDGDETDRKIIGGALYQRDIDDRNFGFGRLELEHDKPSEIDFRSTLTGGLGHYFIKKDHHELRGRAGVGVEYTDFTGGTNQTDIVLDLGYDYMVEIREYLRFINNLTVLTPFDQPKEFRAIMNTGVEVPILPDTAWLLTLGMRNEYENEPQPGVDEFDTWYYLTLGYKWD